MCMHPWKKKILTHYTKSTVHSSQAHYGFLWADVAVIFIQFFPYFWKTNPMYTYIYIYCHLSVYPAVDTDTSTETICFFGKKFYLSTKYSISCFLSVKK